MTAPAPQKRARSEPAPLGLTVDISSVSGTIQAAVFASPRSPGGVTLRVHVEVAACVGRLSISRARAALREGATWLSRPDLLGLAGASGRSRLSFLCSELRSAGRELAALPDLADLLGRARAGQAPHVDLQARRWRAWGWTGSHAGARTPPVRFVGRVDVLLARLGLASGATVADIRRVVRERAKTLHPDRGGDGAAMAQVNAAADELERLLGGGP